MSLEGTLKYLPLILLPLEGPDIQNMCYKSEILENGSSVEWSTTKLFSASQLCSIQIYKVLKICQYIS